MVEYAGEYLSCQENLLTLKMRSLNEISLSFFNTLKHFTVLECLDMHKSKIHFNEFQNSRCEQALNYDAENFDVSNFFDYDFGSLKKSLKSLVLCGCDINNNSRLLLCITECQKLENLDLSKNNLCTIPENFDSGAWKNFLVTLDMSHCQLTNGCCLEKITNFPNLQSLDISCNQFDIFSENFRFGSSERSLINLDARGYHYIGNLQILYAISECDMLETLNISKTVFKNIPNGFNLGKASKSLVKIQACDCGLNTKASLFAFTNCIRLRVLMLDCNDFSKISDICFLGNSKETLEYISINNCKFSFQELFTAFTDCPKLQELYSLDNYFLSNSEGLTLGRAKESLKILEIKDANSTPFNHETITQITSCICLETLRLTCDFYIQEYKFGVSKLSLGEITINFRHLKSVSILECIFDCSKLVSLNISGINLSSVESKITNLIIGSSKSSLEILNAGSCNFSAINTLFVFTSFENLKCLYFEKNQLNRDSEDAIKLGISKQSLRIIHIYECNISLESETDRLELFSCPRLIILLLRSRHFNDISRVYVKIL